MRSIVDQQHGISRSDSGRCEHVATEHLGSYNNVTFSRCQDCAHVLVQQGTRCWVIPPKR